MAIEKLKQIALLKISGADAAGFLQGQLTNDVNALEPVSGDETGIAGTVNRGQWQFSGYCNPKGRLLALFYLWKQDGDYFALLDQSLLEPITKRLTMFVMRSKVIITHMAAAAIAGADSAESAEEWSGLTPATASHGDVLSSGNQSLLVVNQRFLLVMHNGLPMALNDKISGGMNWLRADIEAGLPWVCSATTERFIPQMLNLDLLDGINFKKGCYTGQEIVARMHYLGNLKQRMLVAAVHYPADSENSPQIQPGDKIFADRGLSKSAGTLVSICGSRALVVIRTDYSEQTLYLDADTTVQSDRTQPYQIPG